MVKVINIDTKTRTIHVSNADGDIKTWRTTESGTHFPIRKGESTKEALDKFITTKTGAKTSGLDKRQRESVDKINERAREVAKSEKALGKKVVDFTKKLEKGDTKAAETMIRSAERVYGKDSDEAKKARELYEKKQQPAKAAYEKALGPGEHDYYEGPDQKMIDYVTELAERKKNGEKLSPTNEAYLKQWGRFIGTKTDKDYSKPAPSKDADVSSKSFKSTMQETMKSFPRLYDFEKPALEAFAESVYDDLQKNQGKEQAVLDHLVDAYKSHIAALGMWVDTPTKAKAAFLEKVRDQNLDQRVKERRSGEKAAQQKFDKNSVTWNKATRFFESIDTSKMTDEQLNDMIGDWVKQDLGDDDDGIVTEDELNSKEFERVYDIVKSFVE